MNQLSLAEHNFLYRAFLNKIKMHLISPLELQTEILKWLNVTSFSDEEILSLEKELQKNFPNQAQPNLNLTKYSVVLIDSSMGNHLENMKQVLRDCANGPINIITERVNSPQDVIRLGEKYSEKQNRLIVAPLAWSSTVGRDLWSEVAKNNTVVAAKDAELPYPWSLPHVIVADNDTVSFSKINNNVDTILSITCSSVD